jgi:MFS family permease
MPTFWKKFTSQHAYLKKYSPNILFYVYYGLLFDVVMNLYRPFIPKLLERLGGDNFIFTLFNALPGIVAAVVLIPGSIIISRFKNKKRATAILILLSRTLLLALAATPFFPPLVRAGMFVAFFAFMNLPDSLSQSSVQAFVGQVFNGRERSYAIATRSKFGHLVVIAVTLLTGLIISFLPGSEEQTIIYYQIFIVLAFVFGLAEVVMFLRFKTPEADDIHSETKPPSFSFKDLKGFFSDKRFRKFFFTTLVFTFFWQAAWPVMNILQVKEMGATEIWLAIFAVVSGLTSFFSIGFWNKRINRQSNYFALGFAMCLMPINLVIFGIAPNLPFLLLASLSGGFATAGLTVTLLNGLLASAGEKDRIIVYVGIFNTFTNLSLFVSPFFAFFFVELWGTRETIFFLTVLRVFAAVLFVYCYRKEIFDAKKTELA